MNESNSIRIQTPARAGVLGNPSDGFFGKTIAVPVRNFYAEVNLYESDRIEIFPGPSDNINFSSLSDMIRDIEANGYYGGYRVIKAAIKQFHDYVNLKGISLPDRNFTVQYTSTIPRQVGMAGSSAIITSILKALSIFFDVEIHKAILANYVLWAETKELGISAGLQDRVVQVYDEPIYMDFNKKFMDENGHGIYESFNPDLLPPLFLAYQVGLTHRDRAHNEVRARWERGDQVVRETMVKIGENAREGFHVLKNGDLKKFNECIDENFNLRASIYPISKKNMQMIKLARSIGATAKFPGSGGAIVGTFRNEAVFNNLKKEFEKISCKVVNIQIR
ncbi:MAG: GHMP kinase [Candidatus Helarchaeota archaeon]|nr:GHMP kinase [Candidatus Helarchaeota archaeon]